MLREAATAVERAAEAGDLAAASSQLATVGRAMDDVLAALADAVSLRRCVSARTLAADEEAGIDAALRR